jgi:hypothetical protein
MIIREAAEADIAAIALLLADDGLGRGREAPGDPAYARAFAAMAAQPGNVYLVAEAAGEIIGCLQYTLIHGLSRRGASRAQIEGVRTAFQSERGAGRIEDTLPITERLARLDDRLNGGVHMGAINVLQNALGCSRRPP